MIPNGRSTPIRRGCAGLAALTLAASASWGSPGPDEGQAQAPSYTDDGRLVRPTDYREWVFVTSGLGMTYGPAGAAEGRPPRFDNVFVGRDAHREFLRSGTWPDATMLVLEVRRSEENVSINKGGRTQGEVVALEAAVKDRRRFPGNGWAYFSFDSPRGPIDSAARLPDTATCYACHQSKGAVDNTFVQFYPTLLEAARRLGTLRPGEGEAGAAAKPHAEAPAYAEADTEPSGAAWVSRFPGSRELDDLEPDFRAKFEAFHAALREAGATTRITSTLRPPERAYLMHWSWKVATQDFDPREVPARPGVAIRWWLGDAETSKAKAREMVDGYGLGDLRLAPALDSRHIEGKAVDMAVSWDGSLAIRNHDGTAATIASTPRDGTNADLIAVARTYGVIHVLDPPRDKVQWSTDGR